MIRHLSFTMEPCQTQDGEKSIIECYLLITAGTPG
jgi:hypothetical protein